MHPMIIDNAATQFLIPYVVALKETEEIRSGWDSAIGLYNPSSQARKFRFRYFNDEGNLVVEFLSRPVPGRSNLFDTPETMAEGRSYDVAAGDSQVLLDRRFTGYLIVESDGLSQPFYLSSWMARGGSDFTPQDREEQKSFGFNRASWQVPAIPTSIYNGRSTDKIIFPGLNLQSQSSSDDCPGSSVTGVPNGWDAGVSLVNMGPSPVSVRFSFLYDDVSTVLTGATTVDIAAGARVGVVASRYLPESPGKGVLIATVENGSSPVLGFAAQSDRRFQFFGYGVTGQVLFKEGEERDSRKPTPSLITNLARKFVLPYVLRVDSDEGYNTGLSVFNPSSDDLGLNLSFFNQDGSSSDSFSLTVPGGGAFYRRLEELPISGDFLGWGCVTAEGDVFCAAHIVRGGFDTELRGWQSFGFDVPAVPDVVISPAQGLMFLAVNESLESEAPACPPVSPGEEEDVEHVNGFDIGVRLTNLDDVPVTVRLEFQKRYVGNSQNPMSPAGEVSPGGPYTIGARESIGLVVGSDFGNGPDLDDGALIARISAGGPARLVAVAVESDRFFRWFSYSVVGQQLSTLPEPGNEKSPG